MRADHQQWFPYEGLGPENEGAFDGPTGAGVAPVDGACRWTLMV